jgi:hypothetical protein
VRAAPVAALTTEMRMGWRLVKRIRGRRVVVWRAIVLSSFRRWFAVADVKVRFIQAPNIVVITEFHRTQ